MSDTERFRELIESDNPPSEFKSDPDRYVYRVTLQSNEYLEGEDGWRINTNGDLEVSSIFARGEVDALSFRANRMNAINGSLLITRSAILKEAITPDDEEIIVSDNSFSIGDILYLRLGTQPALLRRSKRTTDKYEYMQVTEGPSYYQDPETGKTLWKYKVTRSFGEPDENPLYWPRGVTIVVWIDKDTGAILLAADRENSPYIDILQRDSTQINSFLTRVRLGKLSGIVDNVLNPEGFGLYTDNCYLRGKLAIGGLQGQNTAIEIFDTTGNRRGLITNTGSGWFGKYDDFRWDEKGTVFIKNLELDNLILTGGGIDATGGIITKIGLQNGLIIQTNTRRRDTIIKWDETRFSIINDKLEDVLDFRSTGKLEIGRRENKASIYTDSTRGILTFESGIRILDEYGNRRGLLKDILMNRDATVVDVLLANNGINCNGNININGDIVVTGDVDGHDISTEFGSNHPHQNVGTTDSPVFVNPKASGTYKTNDSNGAEVSGISTDFTTQGIVFTVTNGLITNWHYKSG